MRRLFPFLALSAALAWGQSETFEAADVHPSAPGATESGGFLPNGRIEFRSTTLLRLISIAWSTPEDRIAGGPNWLNTDRFDVVAMAGSNAPQASLRTRLQKLLAERFQLVAKTGESPVAVYALVLAKGPGKESSGTGDPDCKLETEGGRSYTCHHVSMTSIAERLRLIAPGYFDKPVVDRTGLKGVYDFRLEWVGRNQFRGEPASRFSWVEKPLGVKVEQQTVPMPSLTVESVSRTPSPNPPGTLDKLGAPPTEFEVASLYKSRPGENQDVNMSGGRLEAKALSLREMISFAYNVEEDWVLGGEKWVETERYDLRAKSVPTASADTLRVLTQALLKERFHLKVHKEDRPVSVFALTAIKPKLKDADASSRAACKLQLGGTRTYVCQAATMAEFAAKLQSLAPRYIDHPVVDLTGLKGSYDFTVSWMTAPVLRPDGAAPDERPAGQNIFEAIDKQLGLKLAPQKHPMPVLVIDHVDRAPTEN